MHIKKSKRIFSSIYQSTSVHPFILHSIHPTFLSPSFPHSFPSSCYHCIHPSIPPSKLSATHSPIHPSICPSTSFPLILLSLYIFSLSSHFTYSCYFYLPSYSSISFYISLPSSLSFFLPSFTSMNTLTISTYTFIEKLNIS